MVASQRLFRCLEFSLVVRCSGHFEIEIAVAFQPAYPVRVCRFSSVRLLGRNTTKQRFENPKQLSPHDLLNASLAVCCRFDEAKKPRV